MAHPQSHYEDQEGLATVPFAVWFYVNVALGTGCIVELLKAHDMVLTG